MMYNPYNWNIRSKKEKEEDVEMKMDVYPGKIGCVCILDELTFICHEIEILSLERKKLKEKINDCDKMIVDYEKKRVELINKLF